MSGQSNINNPAPDGALQDLVRLQVKQHRLQTHIMTLLTEQRHDLDTMTKMASNVKYTVEEARIDGGGVGLGCLVW